MKHVYSLQSQREPKQFYNGLTFNLEFAKAPRRHTQPNSDTVSQCNSSCLPCYNIIEKL